MELIIDRNFLDNFYVSFNQGEQSHEDLRAFFKSTKNCTIVTNYDSLEELMNEAENSNPMIHYFIETNVPEFVFKQMLTSDALNDDFYFEGSPFKLLFIENSNSTISEKNGYFSINSLQISEKWTPFFKARHREFNELKTSKDHLLKRHERFEKWEDLNNFKHPIHSIIIADRYLLVDKENQRLEKNLFPLLKSLIGDNINNSHIDLLIISEVIIRNLENIYKRIDNYLSSELKLSKYHFSLVKSPPDKKLEHFRRIYTNNLVIATENSLNVFKDNGSYHDKNNNISVKFIFNDKNYRFAMKELNDISKWLKSVNNRPAIGSDSEKIYYYPDKENMLLNRIK